MSDDPRVKAAASYDAAADHYDKEPLGFWERYGRQTVDRLDLRPGEIVLDVGCGSGASAIPAAERVAPSGRVIGVDLAERLLELARQKATARGLGNVEFRRGDMQALDGIGEGFDAVISVFSIFFVSDMVGLLRNLWQHVGPGGRMAITTWGPRFCEPMNTIWWKSVKSRQPDLHRAFNPWDRITSPNALRDLMSDAGLMNIEAIAEDGHQSLRRPEDWWDIVLGTGYRWTIEQLSADDVAAIRAENIEWAERHNIKQVETNVVFAQAKKESR